MKMKYSLMVMLVSSCLNLMAEKYISEINPLPDEYWYGAYTAKAFCNTPLKDLNFQPFQKNEKKMDLRTDNRGNQAAPFLLSSKGRYVWSDEPFAFEFKSGSLIIYSDYEKAEAIVAGNTLRDAYLAAKDKHFPASGKTPNPMMFKMPQYNMWIELNFNQTQEKVLKYADDVLKNGFPAGVLMIDDNWSKAYGNFEFDANTFPDPKKMMNELHSKGFRVMLWVTPFVSADTRNFKHLLQEGALVMKKDNKTPAMIHWWNGYSACLDLTKPQAVEWLRGHLIKLQQDYGIDGFKFDAADFDFYTSVSSVYSNEETNTSGPLQAEAFGKLGMEFDFNEFRSGWKNGNQPIAQRLQDKRYSWDDLKLLVPDMLSAGLIGHPFTCPDMIGGGLLSDFENIDYSKFDQELMVRSAQIQALMPMMQFSVAPWRVLDEKHLNIVRESALLHAKMGDFIVESAIKASKDGEPMVRHLEYSFPGQGFESCDDQFMFGDKYLVAPMVDKGETREVKLPNGIWVDDLGEKHIGGQTIRMSVPIDRLVYFIQE
jgi:alpha-glucosidase